MVCLGDEAQLDVCSGLFGDSANLDARLVHSLRRMYHKAQKSYWTHPIELLGDLGHVEFRFGPFEDSVRGKTYHRLKNHF
jgi:hypothetical protein